LNMVPFPEFAGVGNQPLHLEQYNQLLSVR
jgi:hypothetical protein